MTRCAAIKNDHAIFHACAFRFDDTVCVDHIINDVFRNFRGQINAAAICNNGSWIVNGTGHFLASIIKRGDVGLLAKREAEQSVAIHVNRSCLCTCKNDGAHLCCNHAFVAYARSDQRNQSFFFRTTGCGNFAFVNDASVWIAWLREVVIPCHEITVFNVSSRHNEACYIYLGRTTKYEARRINDEDFTIRIQRTVILCRQTTGHTHPCNRGAIRLEEVGRFRCSGIEAAKFCEKTLTLLMYVYCLVWNIC